MGNVGLRKGRAGSPGQRRRRFEGATPATGRPGPAPFETIEGGSMMRGKRLAIVLLAAGAVLFSGGAPLAGRGGPVTYSGAESS